MAVLVTLFALLIELAVGYPDQLFHAAGHPVTWMGRLIGWLDRVLNHDYLSRANRRMAGLIALGIATVTSAVVAYALERFLLLLPFGIAGVALLSSALIAQRSLYDHVARVASALDEGGLAEGRAAVSHIVGRDPESLDEYGVARAAIESLAENFSDGVVAPVFWMVFLGLPGGAIYKAINTADSMIGHRTKRHEAFGWAAARLDDLVNLPASRLAAVLIVAAAATMNDGSAREAWRTIRRDADRHRSPNAGYPEAAMAGALGLSLAGPRVYGGVHVEDATMGSGRRDATTADIRAALALYQRADAMLIGLVAAIALPFIAIA
jgi:adenosylcobinamide-phosphate synthase